MGDNDLELKGIFALPCPTINSPLVITPGFGVQYLQGPAKRRFAAAAARRLRRLPLALASDAAVGTRPGHYAGHFSDFEQASSKAFRLTGHGAAAWTWNETTKFVLGAAYLDRPDVELIPIGGVIWTPNDEVTFDLVFPHPKISRRIYWGGQYDDKTQDWVYIAGEFTGDAWAIRRSDGSDDLVVLSDYRVILGLERKVSAE